MTAERWLRVKGSSIAGWNAIPWRVADFLHENCGNEELLRKVEALLAYDGEAGSLLEEGSIPC